MRRAEEACRLLSIVLFGAMVLVGASADSRAAEWRLFGIDGFSGYLGLRSDTLFGETSGVPSDKRSLEQQIRLRLGSYVFHPRFLSLDADTAFALRTSSDGDSGFRNLDSQLVLDLLPRHPLTLGVTVASRVENLERSFVPYQRDVKAGELRLSFNSRLVNSALKYEINEATSLGAQLSGGTYVVPPEDKRTEYLSSQTSVRVPSLDRMSLRYDGVRTDDRTAAGTGDSEHHSAQLEVAQSVLNKRGRVNASASVWQKAVPTEEERLTLLQSWTMDWRPGLRSTESIEATRRRENSEEANTYKVDLGLSRELNEWWRVSGNLGGAQYKSASSESSSYRASGSVGYLKQWQGYRLSAVNTLALSEALAGPSKRIKVYDEKISLPLNGTLPGFWQRLANPFIDESTIKVFEDGVLRRDWTKFCEKRKVGAYTEIRWVPDPTDRDYPSLDPDAQLLPVLVSYDYVLPETDYAELSNNLNLALSREFAPGMGLDSTFSVNTKVPGTAGSGLGGLNFSEAEYELGVQGYLKRPEYEASAGTSGGRDRQRFFLRGSTNRNGWQLSEAYQLERFPDLVGQTFDTRLSHLWGISNKTRLNLELGDQTYVVDGRMERGLSSARVVAAVLFSPFMRIEVETRGEVNRALPNDTRLALDTKYFWQQGQLDLTAGYELRSRTYDRTTTHRLYATIIRRF
ncbi:MAG: hypothetical protein QME79_11925 [Bacillota bacterium]|nr:hypothetical protein [Bacillota bacterium]